MSAGEESEMSEPFPEYWAAKRREVITHLRERAKMLDDPCDDPVDRRTDASIETGLAADDLELLARLRSHKELPDVLRSVADFAVNWRSAAEDSELPDEEPCREACLEKADAYEALLQLLRGDTGQGGG